VDTVGWVTEAISGLNSPKVQKFNWDNLPAKPFTTGTSFPLQEIPEEQPFDLNSFPAIPFSLDSLPRVPMEVKVAPLGNPNIVEAGKLTNAPGATRGVLTMDNSFGLPSLPYGQFTDSQGIFWIGLNNGVARYDSETLAIYDLEQGLEAKYINLFFEDSKGRLWMMGNQGSLSMIDFKSNLVYEIKMDLVPAPNFQMIEDENGLLWMGTLSNGVQILDLDRKFAYHLTERGGLLNNNSFAIFLDAANYLHISTVDGGSHILNPQRDLLYQIEPIDSPNFFSVLDPGGRIWSSGVGKINILNAEKTALSYIPAEHLGVDGNTVFTSIYQDPQEDFWFGTDRGWLIQYSQKTGMVTKYEVAPSNAANKFIYCIRKSVEGDIWMAVAQGGSYMLDLNGPRPGNYDTASGLNNRSVWATLEAADGTIWIGTHGGIDIYDPATKTLKHLGVEQGLIHPRNTNLTEDKQGRIWAGGNEAGISIIDPKAQTIQVLALGSDLKGAGITNTMLSDEGTIWASHFSGEIQNIDLDRRLRRNYRDPDSFIGAMRKDRVVQADPNTLWVATEGDGVHKLDLEGNGRQRYTMDQGLISNTLYSMNLDAKNRLWIATDRGVQMLDEANKKITTFTKAQGLPANDVYDVAVKDGKIYLGSSKGLAVVEPTGPVDKTIWKVQTITKDQGLDFDDFSQNSISFDSEGKLWAGVEGQILTVMDPVKSDTLRISSHITSVNVFDNPLSFRKSGEIDALAVQPDSANMVETVSKASDSTYQKLHGITWEATVGPYNLPLGLELPADQNYLSFNFNGGQYGNPGSVVYRYILEGIDKNWSALTDKTTSENYRDLPPGDYTFKVASLGYNGVWSEPASVSFRIAPPWWLSWWAYLIYLGILALVAKQVHVLQKARTLRKEREKSREKELAQAKEIEKAYTELKATQSQLIQSEKMASLGELTAGIAHEIQNPLNFVNNFSEVNKELLHELNEEIEKGHYAEVKSITKDVIENQEKINFHGKRAEGIVKGMLLHSRNSEGKKEPTDINALADEYLRLAYHGLRAKDKSFNAHFQTDFDDKLPETKVVPQDLGRVLLNLINNAFYAVNKKENASSNSAGEATYKPTVKVSTKYLAGEKGKGGTLRVSVSDNGTGIPKSLADKIFQPFFTTKPTGQGTGLGLSLSYDIIKAHGGTLEVQSEEGKGTEFIIKLPVL
jgi:signal transduction histidine kinase/ligand-binding sensor domain-containing protein